jgi:hypothetical protein
MHPDEDTMRRTLCSNLTPEDRATHAKWVRVVATVYGCAALLLLLVAITLPGPSQPRGSALLADPPDRSGPADAAAPAQQRAWRSSPIHSSGETRVGLDPRNR